MMRMEATHGTTQISQQFKMVKAMSLWATRNCGIIKLIAVDLQEEKK